MNLHPILSVLARHKTAAALIVLEIALSCAIICNAVFLIGDRLNYVHQPSGIDESQLVKVQVDGIGRNLNPMALTREDLAALRGIPGVTSVAIANQIPFGQSSSNSGITLSPEQTRATTNATLYMGGNAVLDTFGLRLVAGRKFTPEEHADVNVDQVFESIGMHAAIITDSLARLLFPGQQAVGKNIYFGDAHPIRVVGVVEHLVRPGARKTVQDFTLSILLPVNISYTAGGGYYVLRTAPEQRQRVLDAAVAALERNSSDRIVRKPATLEEVRDGFFRQDRAMVWLLVVVCVALLTVTALGIVGLASFWVQQRTKQIGVRRALGATRGQILRYFQAENFLLATIGIVIGMAMAYGINLALMSYYELPRLPASYFPIGALTLWVLGQVAVFGPARRAASVPPAVATRST